MPAAPVAREWWFRRFGGSVPKTVVVDDAANATWEYQSLSDSRLMTREVGQQMSDTDQLPERKSEIKKARNSNNISLLQEQISQ
jgi:hypothetical protein